MSERTVHWESRRAVNRISLFLALIASSFFPTGAVAQNTISVALGTSAPVQTLTYQFNNSTTLSAVSILTSGAPGLDYTDGGSSTCLANTAYPSGSICTVTVAFTPSAPGVRAGGVALFAQGSSLPLTTWYLSGVGLAGSVTIDPGTETTIGAINGGAPYGSALDGAGNIYLADHANGQVVELVFGTLMQNVVLTGLSGPTAVAIDGLGNLFVSDTQNNRVVRVPNENGTLNAADMSAISINGLGSPRGIAVDSSGNLYVADVTNGCVWEVPAGGGTPVPLFSNLVNPHGVAIDATGNIYVVANNGVTEYPSNGTPISMGTGYGNPRGLSVDAAGNVFVADAANAAIVEVFAGGATQSKLAIAGLAAPQAVSLDSAGNLYVTDSNNIYQINRSSGLSLNFPTASVGSTSPAQTVTVTDAGNQPLMISGFAIPGNFAQGVSGGADCNSSSVLPSAGLCLISVAFAPVQSGVLTGTFTLTDNALNNSSSIQSVQVSGIGSQVAESITFTIGAPTTAAYNSNFTVASGASSGLPVSYTSAGACTNSGPIYLLTSGTGTCTVIVNQSGNGEYSPAPQVTQIVNAVPIAQAITFATNAPPDAIYNTSFVVSANANSGLGVVYTSAGACSNSGNSFTITNGTGMCTAIANQPGNNNYSAAPQMVQSTHATQASQTIAFTTKAPASAMYGSTFTVVAAASSGLATAYTSSGDCTNSGATYTMKSVAGVCTVTANQSGDQNYKTAPRITESTTAVPSPFAQMQSSITSSNFGSILPGQSSSVTATFTCTIAPCKILGFKAVGPGYGNGESDDFTSDKGCEKKTFDQGEQCTETFTFTADGDDQVCNPANTKYPNEGCTGNVSLTVANSIEPASFTYQVIVLNPYPTVSVTPTTMSFGSVPIGEPSDAQTFAIENTGHVDLKITSIVVSMNSAVFSIISNDCPAVLSSGESCDVQLEFTPTEAGEIVGQVKISDNAFPQGSFPSTVRLAGTGLKP